MYFIELQELYDLTNEEKNDPKILEDLYLKLYKVLRYWIINGNYDLYNTLSDEDKIHLLPFFAQELKMNRLGTKNTSYFNDKITCLDYQGLDLGIIKEYLEMLVLTKPSKKVFLEPKYDPKWSTLEKATWLSMNKDKIKSLTDEEEIYGECYPSFNSTRNILEGASYTSPIIKSKTELFLGKIKAKIKSLRDSYTSKK